MNPLITPQQVIASDPNLKVDGVFNAGATKYQDKIILLLRVAESFINNDPSQVLIPVMSADGLKKVCLDVNDPKYDFTDSRIIKNIETGQTEYLTSISHIRLASSTDGENFQIADKPIDLGYEGDECWGVEDPRITKIEDEYFINYTSVSERGASTSLISTTDFEQYQRHGLIFLPENKDVCILSEKIDGYYYAYNRPVPKAFGSPDIWISKSPDLIHWGQHKHLLGVSSGDSWDNERIGGGAPAIKTSKGWLSIYHACDRDTIYRLGAFLTSLTDPGVITHKTQNAILSPDEEYEKQGFFGNVVFTCGVVEDGDDLLVYYGAADDKIAMCKLSISQLLETMEEYNG